MVIQRRKKIGFIFDEAPPSAQAMDMLCRLVKIDDLNITLVQNIFPGQNRFGIKRKFLEYGALLFMNKLAFAACSALEEKLVRRNVLVQQLVPGMESLRSIAITPLPTKRNLVYRYSNEDLETIKQQNFDLLVRGDGRGIVKGDILYAAQDGVFVDSLW